MITILIADASEVILDCLSSLLNQKRGLEVVGLARDGVEAVDKARELLPNVVIMDAQMPNMDGIEATRRIKQEAPAVGILFFSVFTDQLEASLDAGADGYIGKDCDPGELISEVKRITAAMRAAKG